MDTSSCSGSITHHKHELWQAVHEFEGEGGTTIDFGTGSFSAFNRRLPTYGRGEAGLNIRMPSGVSGFIQFDLDRAANYRSYGGQAGLRIAF